MAQQAPVAATTLRLVSLDTPHPRGSDYDALTELFLGPTPGPGMPRTSGGGGRAPVDGGPQAGEHRTVPRLSPAAPVMEGLILGHLPVMASAWAMQYARQRAEDLGEPVAIVRFRGGEVSIEVVSAPHGEAPVSPAPMPTLEEALGRARALASHWIVRIDGSGEGAIADHPTLDAVTLLSGADQAATVAAYRTIKELFTPAGERAASHPRVRIAILGSPDGRAAAARAALARAAAAFLEREVEITSGPGRIGSSGAPAALLYFGSNPGIDEVLVRVRQCLDAPADVKHLQGATAEAVHAQVAPAMPVATGESSTAGKSEPALPEVVAQRVHAGQARGEAEVNSAVASEGSDRAEAPVSAASAVQVALPEVRSPPTSSAAREAAGRGAMAPGSLAQHLGLAALPVRCPHAPGVELAIDGDGGLHLLAHMAGQGGMAAPGGHDPVHALLAASAWAAEHTPLLQFAAPAMKDWCPTLHVLTGDAKAVRGLLATGIRVHLLSPVSVAGREGWFCGALN